MNRILYDKLMKQGVEAHKAGELVAKMYIRLVEKDITIGEAIEAVKKSEYPTVIAIGLVGLEFSELILILAEDGN